MWDNEKDITEMFEQVGIKCIRKFKSQLEELYNNQSTTKAKYTVDEDREPGH